MNVGYDGIRSYVIFTVSMCLNLFIIVVNDSVADCVELCYQTTCTESMLQLCNFCNFFVDKNGSAQWSASTAVLQVETFSVKSVGDGFPLDQRTGLVFSNYYDNKSGMSALCSCVKYEASIAEYLTSKACPATFNYANNFHSLSIHLIDIWSAFNVSYTVRMFHVPKMILDSHAPKLRKGFHQKRS